MVAKQTFASEQDGLHSEYQDLLRKHWYGSVLLTSLSFMLSGHKIVILQKIVSLLRTSVKSLITIGSNQTKRLSGSFISSFYHSTAG